MWEGGEGGRGRGRCISGPLVVLWGEIWEALIPQGCLLQHSHGSKAVWG